MVGFDGPATGFINDVGYKGSYIGRVTPVILYVAAIGPAVIPPGWHGVQVLGLVKCGCGDK